MTLLPLLLLASLAVAKVSDSIIENFELALKESFQRTILVREKEGWRTGVRYSLRRLESGTIARIPDGRYIGLAHILEEVSGKLEVTEFLVDGKSWTVVRKQVLNEEQLESWSAEDPVTLRRSGPPPQPSSGTQRAATADYLDFIASADLKDISGKPANLMSCSSGSRCALLVVDPWHPTNIDIVVIRGELKARGVPLRVVVTTDQPSEQLKRARTLGADSVVDPENSIRVRGVGLPRLVLIDDGRIHKNLRVFDFSNPKVVVTSLLESPAPEARASTSTAAAASAAP